VLQVAHSVEEHKARIRQANELAAQKEQHLQEHEEAVGHSLTSSLHCLILIIAPTLPKDASAARA
jgi:hypothetical protein